MTENLPAVKGDYLLANSDINVTELIEESLGGESFSPFDLDRIKVPTQGTIVWDIGENPEKELSGIILFSKVVRAYYREDYSGESVPPDCSSNDLINGVGNPGRVCSSCSYAQWGSADKGKGQACKTSRILFLLREGNVLPAIVKIPPTSLKDAKNYLIKDIGGRLLRPYDVVTQMTLKKDKGDFGDFSRVQFKAIGAVPDEMKEGLRTYIEKIKPGLIAGISNFNTEDAPPSDQGV